MYEFQIVTKTEAEAERFMEAIDATDVSVEDWSGSRPGEEYENYICGFGLARLTPKQFNRVSDVLGVALIYVEHDG